MRAASHALTALLVAAAVLVTLPTTATAQAATPSCPAVVADQPLSVSVPFSGTPRPVAGDDGEVDSTSLLCAYGEGVEPSAELLLTWTPGGCGDTNLTVAPGLDRAAFRAVSRDLVATVGGACPPTEPGAAIPVVPIAAGLVAVLLLIASIVRVRGRRRRSVVDAPAPSVSEPTEPDAPARPSLQPVLAHLTAADGRAFARTSAGQWLTLSAVAYGSGHAEAGDLARVGAHDARATRRPARPELVALARGLAHQDEAVGR